MRGSAVGEAKCRESLLDEGSVLLAGIAALQVSICIAERPADDIHETARMQGRKQSQARYSRRPSVRSLQLGSNKKRWPALNRTSKVSEHVVRTLQSLLRSIGPSDDSGAALQMSSRHLGYVQG